MDSIEGERALLIKEALETLIAANRRELCVLYLEKIDLKYLKWEGEDKNYYFAIVLTKLGSLELKDDNYNGALLYFDMALDYFRKIVNENKKLDEATTNKILFDILFSIATCCYEENEIKRAIFFNEKVNLYANTRRGMWQRRNQ